MKIIIHWIILSLVVLAMSYLIAGIGVNPFYVALIVGACLTVMNLILKPIIKIVTLPINLITFGLFSVVLNVALFYGLSFLIGGFSITTIYSALIGSLIVSLVNWIFEKF